MKCLLFLLYLNLLLYIDNRSIAIFNFPLDQGNYELNKKVIEHIASETQTELTIYIFQHIYDKNFNVLYSDSIKVEYITYGTKDEGKHYYEIFFKSKKTLDEIDHFEEFQLKNCENLMKLTQVINFFISNPLDLAITDINFRCSYHFLRKIKPRNVIYFSQNPTLPICRLPIFTLGHLPHQTTSYDEEMNIFQRFGNIVQSVSSYLIDKIKLSKFNKINEINHFEKIRVPCDESHGIYLVQSIQGYDYGVVLPQNVVSVGSILASNETFEKLDSRILEFINSFDDIIFIDLSRIMKSKKLEVFKNVLNSLNQASFIILSNQEMERKLNSFDFSNNNILLINKLKDYNHILSHPKVKLFITKASQNLITLAIYHRKPIIAISYSIDQNQNAAKINYRKIGFGYFSEKEIDELDLIKKIEFILKTPQLFLDNLEYFSKVAKNYKLKRLLNEYLELSFDIGFDHLLPTKIYSMNMIYFYNLDILFIGFVLGILILAAIVYFIMKGVKNCTRKKEKLKDE